MLIDPAGKALFPCNAAGVIPGLEFENVRERTLEWILAGIRLVPQISR